MTEEELQKIYSKWTNATLLDALANEEDYTPMAISVIKSELKSRNITQAENEQHYNSAKAKRAKRYITIKFDLDLNPWLKAFFYFLFRVPFLTEAIRNDFRKKGHLLQLNQSRYYSFFGFGSLMASIIISINYDWSALSLFACWISGFVLAYCCDLGFSKQSYILQLKQRFPEGKAILDRELL